MDYSVRTLVGILLQAKHLQFSTVVSFHQYVIYLLNMFKQIVETKKYPSNYTFDFNQALKTLDDLVLVSFGCSLFMNLCFPVPLCF